MNCFASESSTLKGHSTRSSFFFNVSTQACPVFHRNAGGWEGDFQPAGSAHRSFPANCGATRSDSTGFIPDFAHFPEYAPRRTIRLFAAAWVIVAIGCQAQAIDLPAGFGRAGGVKFDMRRPLLQLDRHMVPSESAVPQELHLIQVIDDRFLAENMREDFVTLLDADAEGLFLPSIIHIAHPEAVFSRRRDFRIASDDQFPRLIGAGGNGKEIALASLRPLGGAARAAERPGTLGGLVSLLEREVGAVEGAEGFGFEPDGVRQRLLGTTGGSRDKDSQDECSSQANRGGVRDRIVQSRLEFAKTGGWCRFFGVWSFGVL